MKNFYKLLDSMLIRYYKNEALRDSNLDEVYFTKKYGVSGVVYNGMIDKLKGDGFIKEFEVEKGLLKITVSGLLFKQNYGYRGKRCRQWVTTIFQFLSSLVIAGAAVMTILYYYHQEELQQCPKEKYHTELPTK